MKKVAGFLVFLAAGILVYGSLGATGVLPESNWDPVAFLLGVCGLAATIAGIGFALYGYYNINHAEKIIEQKLRVKLEEFKQEAHEESIKMQEALQKLITGYNMEFNVKNIDAAISLYEQAVQTYPKVYNGFTALAYAYWNHKNDLVLAKEYFDLALQYSPNSYQALFDLARFSASNGELLSAYNYLKRALDINPDSYRDIEPDPAFHPVRNHYP
ncbi:tetratricopeptide repeat protein [Effusibacillus lacus]|uniref:Uncharacterized protein n=1 Tax=Effusibacillus lacus TaxID=1348429 RepID=A0A292YTG0_9BACL|nr:hypothetical protein [Effusibacillus lacus]TCS73745.1 tetratricopeptide repeat protein [Effusibacillus lacus]GAX92043.1 hypothetical protein EFBL_3734 [Effusibacillus lacus]